MEKVNTNVAHTIYTAKSSSGTIRMDFGGRSILIKMCFLSLFFSLFSRLNNSTNEWKDSELYKEKEIGCRLPVSGKTSAFSSNLLGHPLFTRRFTYALNCTLLEQLPSFGYHLVASIFWPCPSHQQLLNRSAFIFGLLLVFGNGSWKGKGAGTWDEKDI